MKLELGLVALACTLVAVNLQRGAYAESAPGVPRLGVYDPHGLLKTDRNVSMEHIFLDWNDVHPDGLRKTAAQAADRGRQLMVSLEPWTRAPNKVDGRESLLPAILSGGFDREIASACEAIGAVGSPVMINWGHEMDEDEGRFPWANHDPASYKNAYRYFVDKCRSYAPTARFGWTPKGETNLASYYPGNDHVDFVGLTLFDSQAWNSDHQDRRSFEEKFGDLHEQAADFGKPIILAEFGVNGDEAYREKALSCVREQVAKFSDVEAIVYFNDRETWTWPAPYGRPDWRVSDRRQFRCERKEAILRAASTDRAQNAGEKASDGQL